MPVQSKLFTSDPQVRDRLNKALVSDPDHIVPGAVGDHVAKIQTALSILGKVAINSNEVDQELYGPTTADAVEAFKASCKPPLLNFKNSLDNITGKKTTRELDRQMQEFEKNNPSPPAPPPPAGTADVQIGPLGPRAEIVASYYQNCARETVGPARVITAGLRTYTTFEGLIDLLRSRTGLQQVVVNHGNSTDGLLVRWCHEATDVKTGAMIGFFGRVADAIEKGTAHASNTDFQDAVDTIKFILGVSEAVILRIARKMVELRKKQFVLHFRACNLTRQLAVAYKQALGALMISFHSVRLVYLRVKPVRFSPGHSPAEFPFANNTARDRARVFVDPFGELTTLVVAVRDLDGHTDVFDFSFVERLVPAEIQEWAETLIGNWSGPPGQFVMPVMWDNTERSWDTPGEDSWRERLQFV